LGNQKNNKLHTRIVIAAQQRRGRLLNETPPPPCLITGTATLGEPAASRVERARLASTSTCQDSDVVSASRPHCIVRNAIAVSQPAKERRYLQYRRGSEMIYMLGGASKSTAPSYEYLSGVHNYTVLPKDTANSYGTSIRRHTHSHHGTKHALCHCLAG
jgi:hypothetical protein